MPTYRMHSYTNAATRQARHEARAYEANETAAAEALTRGFAAEAEAAYYAARLGLVNAVAEFNRTRATGNVRTRLHLRIRDRRAAVAQKFAAWQAVDANAVELADI